MFEVTAGEQWRGTVEGSPVAVAVIARDGRFVYANPVACLLYGVSAEGLVGRSSIGFVGDADRARIARTFRRVLAGEVVRGQRWALLAEGGLVVAVEINAAPITYGGATAVQVELRDMTAHVAAEQALRDSERRWRDLFARSPVGIALSDDTAHIVAANDALCRMLGRSEADVVGHTSAEFLHPDDRSSRDRNTLLLARSPDGVLREERRYLDGGGSVRWAWLTVSRVPGDGEEPWTLAHLEDITARKNAEAAVAESQADLAAVAEVVKRIRTGGDATQMVVDAASTLSYADTVGFLEASPDRTTLCIRAATDADLVGTTVALTDRAVAVETFNTGQPIFVAETTGSALITPDLVALTGSRSVYGVPVRDADSVVGVLTVGWAHPVADLDDRRARVVRLLAEHAGVAMHQSALVSELEALATTDPLTGLPNRRAWDLLVDRLLALTGRAHLPLTVALIDLDHFKRYNDTHGHPAGDDLLHRFAHQARAAIRDADTLARWGGEEFAVALPCCPAAEAAPVLDRIRGVVPDGQTCSIGYSVWDGRQDARALTELADQALYAAKAAGRDRIATISAQDSPLRHHGT